MLIATEAGPSSYPLLSNLSLCKVLEAPSVGFLEEQESQNCAQGREGEWGEEGGGLEWWRDWGNKTVP